MTVGIFSAFIPPTSRFLARPQVFHKMAVANAEKLVALQMASLKHYAELHLAQWRAAAQVENPATLLHCVIMQGECTIKIGEQLRADAQKVSQLGIDFLYDVQRSVQESAAYVTVRDRETDKAAARKAA